MDLRETSLGFYRAWHIATGVEHGLLVALRDAPLGPEALARVLAFDGRRTQLWCEGAWALGLLTKDRKERYRLAAAHRKTLGEPASTAYLGHHFHYLAAKSLTFGAMGDLLRGTLDPTLDLGPTYAIATRYDHVASLAGVPAALRRRLETGIDVLDLGAGQGGWTRAAHKRFPSSRFTATDLDLAPLRALDGVRLLDARALPEASFDLVHLGEVLASARDTDEVVQAAFRALRPGGDLLCIEGLRPEGAPRDWGERLVLAMGLDFSMDGSRYLSAAEVQGPLDRAGFTKVSLKDLGGSLFRIRAHKPETSRGR